MQVFAPLPSRFFLTSGTGESDIATDSEASSPVTYEANSNDAATVQAKIENLNTVEYSSLLPANIICTPWVPLPFASVVGVIRAQANGRKGKRLTAALFLSEILRREQKEGAEWRREGYFATEYGGHFPLSSAYDVLWKETMMMVNRRGWGKFSGDVKLDEDKILVKKWYMEDESGLCRIRVAYHIGESFVPQQQHGTAIAVAVIYQWRQTVI
jgi:pyruvoyl-dependent arginine decarboxylase (PvlArgDC)